MSVEAFTKFSEVWIGVASAILVAALVLPHLSMSKWTKVKGMVGMVWLLGALTTCYGFAAMRAASFMFHRSEHFADATIFWFMSGVFFLTSTLWYRRTSRYLRKHGSS